MKVKFMVRFIELNREWSTGFEVTEGAETVTKTNWRNEEYLNLCLIFTLFRSNLSHNVDSTQLDMQVGVIFDAAFVQ